MSEINIPSIAAAVLIWVFVCTIIGIRQGKSYLTVELLKIGIKITSTQNEEQFYYYLFREEVIESSKYLYIW